MKTAIGIVGNPLTFVESMRPIAVFGGDHHGVLGNDHCGFQLREVDIEGSAECGCRAFARFHDERARLICCDLEKGFASQEGYPALVWQEMDGYGGFSIHLDLGAVCQHYDLFLARACHDICTQAHWPISQGESYRSTYNQKQTCHDIARAQQRFVGCVSSEIQIIAKKMAGIAHGAARAVKNLTSGWILIQPMLKSLLQRCIVRIFLKPQHPVDRLCAKFLLVCLCVCHA
ncbi:hypothetical protein HNQ72_000779 [Rhizobium wenxiniae]|uniref:Uncharacterized protein n=1 Tax=Rhizobium wenxiniae TaxID=1737357 RepID=A0A7W9Y2T6_9HYPH|nr:hypothetical protein [Rhizobium wenxiniae]MBB6160982.1 hypothetical protein [Rhizobium wenxiniae]